MSKQKYYAVKVGKTPGIYLSWEECKSNTEGYSGAVFKSFPSREEAEGYLLGEQSRKESENDRIDNTLTELKAEEAAAFVDGSFDAVNRRAGYGVILIEDGGRETEFSGNLDGEADESLLDLRNVAAELFGTMAAVDLAISLGKKKLTIYYDYAGIGAWAEGSWEAKKTLTREYVRFLRERREKIDLIFVKVPAHTGVEYNERVDTLAKKSIDIEG